MAERPFTTKSAAEYLDCSERNVRNLCHAGKLRCFRVGCSDADKGPIRIPASAIEVMDFVDAVDQFSLTTLRNVIGSCTLDEVLTARTKVTDTARAILDEVTEKWGVHIQRVEIKQIELPETMKRAMAREAEAIREKRARIIKSEGERDASENLVEAGRTLAASPGSIELRRFQMLSEVGAEHNSTIIVTVPQEILAAVGSIAVATKAGSLEKAKAAG